VGQKTQTEDLDKKQRRGLDILLSLPAVRMYNTTIFVGEIAMFIHLLKFIYCNLLLNVDDLGTTLGEVVH